MYKLCISGTVFKITVANISFTMITNDVRYNIGLGIVFTYQHANDIAHHRNSCSTRKLCYSKDDRAMRAI